MAIFTTAGHKEDVSGQEFSPDAGIGYNLERKNIFINYRCISSFTVLIYLTILNS